MEKVNVKLLREHLDARCPENVIAEKKGIMYLPIDKCERMLDELCSEFRLMWHTRNYKSRIYPFGDDLIISASIELVLTGHGYFRCSVGATSFFAKDYSPNTFFDAIAKSLATVNAAADLGDYFGRYLSNQEGSVNEKKEKRKAPVKMPPDDNIKKEYAIAVATKNFTKAAQMESIYNFK